MEISQLPKRGPRQDGPVAEPSSNRRTPNRVEDGEIAPKLVRDCISARNRRLGESGRRNPPARPSRKRVPRWERVSEMKRPFRDG
jgi:hypothetical protein